MNCLYFSLCATKESNDVYIRMLKNALRGLKNHYDKENGYDVIVTSNIDIEFPEFDFVEVLRTNYTDLYDVCDYYQTYDKETFTIEEYLNRNLHSSWMHKWYALEQIVKLGYDRILFSDCDVLINGNLNNIFSLFDEIDDKNIFYASLCRDEKFEKYFVSNNTVNSGHFLFRPDKVNKDGLYELIVKKRKYMDNIMAGAYERNELTVSDLEHFGFFSEQYCAQFYFEECGYNIKMFPQTLVGGSYGSLKPEEVTIFHYFTNYKDQFINYHTKCNSIDADIDPEILEQIKVSLSNPTAYLQNMKHMNEINWTWDEGKTSTELIYADGDIQNRSNEEIPPTTACHDIAHFIACFNGNMEWDYKQQVNHLCEYNAVLIENILIKICHNIMYGIDSDYKLESQQVFDYLKWFSEDYYKISQNHPSKKDYIQVMSDFLNVWDIDKTARAFKLFYEVWAVEKYVGSPKFKMNVNMKNQIDFYDKRVYDALCVIKENLRTFL